VEDAMMRKWIVGPLLAALLMTAACGPKADTGATDNKPTDTKTASNDAGKGDKPLVVFAQANSQDPWRQVFDRDTKDAAAKHSSEFDFEMQEAGGDSVKQIGQVETFLVKKPKVLLISANDESVQAAVEKATDAGVSVILLDRSVPGDKWTAYVGGDNVEIGRQAAELMATKMNQKGTILMIQGIAAAAPTHDRAGGFMEVMKKYPGITVIQGDDCGYERQKAQNYMERFLQSNKPFDAVYAHNDEMAIGAVMAMEAAKTPKKVVVGIDGCQKEVVEMIKAGRMDATFKYPQPGPPAIEMAAEIIKGNMPKDKKMILPTEMVTKENADAYLAANPNLAQ
jgi:ribose transport system substrate-binding protein